MTKEEILEVFAELPINELKKLIANKLEPLQVEELHAVPNEITIDGKVSYVLTSSESDREFTTNRNGEFVSSSYFSLHKCSNNAVLLKKGMLINNKPLDRVIIDPNTGVIYIICKGKQIL